MAEAFFVAGGRVCHRARLGEDDWREGSRPGLAALRLHARRPPGLLPADALDEVTIVEERLRASRDDHGVLVLGRGWRSAEVLAHIERAVVRLAGTPRQADREIEDA